MTKNLLRRVKVNDIPAELEDVPLKTLNAIILLSMLANFCFPHITLANTVKKVENKAVVYNKAILRAAPRVLGVQTAGNFEERQLEETAKIEVSYTKYVTLTAYSSTVDQCDSTPFITANGTRVHDGTIAANFLKFGTKVRIPEYFGDKIFTVEDRTHPRYGDRVDIWMETRQQALNFGKRRLTIEILK
jgi:3D (Asp-Asp-Asp) domain-containing protein